MKERHILSVFGQVNEDYIEQAASTIGKSQRPKKLTWGKLATMAACLCIVLAIAPFINRLISDPTPPLRIITLNNSMYEVCEDPAILQQLGLPEETTEEMIGGHIAYLERIDGETHKNSTYAVTEQQTDIELYSFKSIPGESALILRDGDYLTITLFCGYQISDNENMPVTSVLELYGIDSSEDISFIAMADVENKGNIGSVVKNKEAVERFYTLLVAMQAYSENEYEKITYGNISEENVDKFYNDFHDSEISLVIETTTGLRLYISMYVEYGWIYAYQTQTYYQMSDAMIDWCNSNLD